MSSMSVETAGAPANAVDSSLLLSVELIQEARDRDVANKSDGGDGDGGGTGRSDGYTE